MLESIPARRYQVVEEVLQDLNEWLPPIIKTPTTNNQPPTTNNPPLTIHNQPTTNSQIDTELEEIKTMFTSGSKPKNNINSPSQQPTNNPPSSKSKIDEELEEMRKKFLGNNP